jgi:hypothetical protein
VADDIFTCLKFSLAACLVIKHSQKGLVSIFILQKEHLNSSHSRSGQELRPSHFQSLWLMSWAQSTIFEWKASGDVVFYSDKNMIFFWLSSPDISWGAPTHNRAKRLQPVIIFGTESLTTVPRSQSHDSFVFEFFQVHFPFCTSQFLSDFLICCLFAILFEPTSWTERPVRTINLKWPAMLILCVDTSLDTQLLAGPVGDWRTKWT